MSVMTPEEKDNFTKAVDTARKYGLTRITFDLSYILGLIGRYNSALAEKEAQIKEDNSVIKTLTEQRDYWKDRAETLQNLQNFGI